MRVWLWPRRPHPCLRGPPGPHPRDHCWACSPLGLPPRCPQQLPRLSGRPGPPPEGGQEAPSPSPSREAARGLLAHPGPPPPPAPGHTGLPCPHRPHGGRAPCTASSGPGLAHARGGRSPAPRPPREDPSVSSNVLAARSFLARCPPCKDRRRRCAAPALAASPFSAPRSVARSRSRGRVTVTLAGPELRVFPGDTLPPLHTRPAPPRPLRPTSSPWPWLLRGPPGPGLLRDWPFGSVSSQGHSVPEAHPRCSLCHHVPPSSVTAEHGSTAWPGPTRDPLTCGWTGLSPQRGHCGEDPCCARASSNLRSQGSGAALRRVAGSGGSPTGSPPSRKAHALLPGLLFGPFGCAPRCL